MVEHNSILRTKILVAGYLVAGISYLFYLNALAALAKYRKCNRVLKLMILCIVVGYVIV